MQVLRDYEKCKVPYQPTAVESKAISSGAAGNRLTMLLAYRSMMLTMANNESKYVRVGYRRAYSISRAMHIREIDSYGTASQHQMREGEGVGAIWRLLGMARMRNATAGFTRGLLRSGSNRAKPGHPGIAPMDCRSNCATGLAGIARHQAFEDGDAVRTVAASEKGTHILRASNQTEGRTVSVR